MLVKPKNIVTYEAEHTSCSPCKAGQHAKPVTITCASWNASGSILLKPPPTGSSSKGPSTVITGLKLEVCDLANEREKVGTERTGFVKGQVCKTQPWQKTTISDNRTSPIDTSHRLNIKPRKTKDRHFSYNWHTFRWVYTNFIPKSVRSHVPQTNPALNLRIHYHHQSTDQPIRYIFQLHNKFP